MTKLLFIGLDGATWKILKPLIEKGEMPNLKSLVDDGVYGNLKSTVPSITAPAWTSMATGNNPGKNGIFDFIDSSGNLVNTKTIEGKRFWNILSRNNLNCCVINYPLTYPPEEIGFMVSDYLTPHFDSNIVYPEDGVKYLEKADYKLTLSSLETQPGKEGDKIKGMKIRNTLINEIYDVTQSRFNLANLLLKEKNWDFFALIIKETDDISHLFWGDDETLTKYFKKVDENIGILLDNFEKTQGEHLTIVVSDHGFGESYTKGFNLYPIMKKLGMAERSPIVRLGSYVLDTPFGDIALKIVSKVWFIRQMLIKNLYVKKGARLWGVYLQDKKKIPKLIKILKDAKDPVTKEKIFTTVGRREDFYNGGYVNEAPDVVYITNPKYKSVYIPMNKIFTESYSVLPGDHFSFPDGVVVVSGDEIKKSKLDMNIEDITPIVLNIFDLPIPKDLDGKVRDIFNIKKKIKYQKADDEIVLLKEKISGIDFRGKI